MLFDGPVPSVPWRNKDSGFFQMSARVTLISAWEEPWSIFWAMMDASGEQLVYRSVLDFFLFLSAEIMVLGGKISLLTALA